jgi:hypothetical protein
MTERRGPTGPSGTPPWCSWVPRAGPPAHRRVQQLVEVAVGQPHNGLELKSVEVPDLAGAQVLDPKPVAVAQAVDADVNLSELAGDRAICRAAHPTPVRTVPHVR